MVRDKASVRTQRGWFHKLRWLHIKARVCLTVSKDAIFHELKKQLKKQRPKIC